MLSDDVLMQRLLTIPGWYAYDNIEITIRRKNPTGAQKGRRLYRIARP